MGVHQLFQFIKKKYPQVIKDTHLKEYDGKCIGIDVSIFLNKFTFQANQHVTGFFGLILNLVENGVTPVLVFDGEAGENKQEELEKRRTERAKVQEAFDERVQEIGDLYGTFDPMALVRLDEELSALMRRLNRPGPKQKKELKILATLMGVPIVQARTEADCMLSRLSRDGLIAAAATDDSDMLTWGCNIARDLNKNSNYVTIYSLETLLEETRLEMEQFIEVCILMTCDYNKGCSINGIGPITAISLCSQYRIYEMLDWPRSNSEMNELIDADPENEVDIRKQYGLFERYIKTADNIHPDFGEKYMTALESFKGAYKAENISVDPEVGFKRRVPDYKRLTVFLESNGIAKSSIKKNIRDYKKACSSGRNARIESFFTKE